MSTTNINDLLSDSRLASVKKEIQQILSNEILQALRDGKRVIVAPRQSGKSYAEILYALETKTQMILHSNESKNHAIAKARKIGKIKAKNNVPNLFYSISDFWKSMGCPRWNFVFSPSTQHFNPFKDNEEIFDVNGNSLKSNFMDHFSNADLYYALNSKRIKALIATAFLN